MSKTRKEYIRSILNFAKEHGYRAFENTREDFAYGWLITPNGNLLYIQKSQFYGYEVGLEYKPSRETGSGCICNEDPLYDVSVEILKKTENDGLAYAKKINATLYNHTEILDFFHNYWDKENVIEL